MRISETGWVMYVGNLTNDCYGTVILEYQGADLQTQSIEIYPEAGVAIGAFAQDAAGWVQRYSRPNPDSTAGIYYALQLTSGYQGAPFPFVPSIVVKLYLPRESTQSSAYVYGTALVVAITDKKAFIQSLRRLLDAKASLKIDPALLAIGPAEFKEVP